jgi:peroxiredoxin
MIRRLTLFAFLLPLISVASIPEDPLEVNPVEVGSTLPDVYLTDAEGHPIALRELAAQQATVIVFYRGGWCPYCNLHLAAFGEIEARLMAEGYKIIALSPDRVEKVREVASLADYKYSLYSDATMEVAKAFGLAFRAANPSTKTINRLEAASGETHHLLPVPAVFVANAEGRIIFRYYNADYKQRLSAEALLEAIQAN